MSRFTLARAGGFVLEAEEPVLPADAVPVVGEAIDMLRRAQAIRETVLRGSRRRFERACEEGLAHGRQEASREAAATLGRAIESLEAALRAARAAHEARMLDLVLAVVERIAGEVGDRSIVAGLAARALADLDADVPVRIRVHPSVAQAVAQAPRAVGPAVLEVLGDPGLGVLDCEIDTGEGVVEAGLAVQLESVRAALSAGGQAG